MMGELTERAKVTFINDFYKKQNAGKSEQIAILQAENIANWTQKGTLIGVTGRIQTRNYENQQGQRVYVTEVVAETFQVMESRNNQHGGQSQGSYQNGGQSAFGNNQPMDISDDDLPF